jgi:hypothetical protein
VKRAQGESGGGRLVAQPVAVDRRAREILGDQALLVGADERRGDAQRSGSLGRDAFGAAVDAEQLGVAPRQPQNAVALPEADAIVAVGDAALQGDRLPLDRAESPREPLHDDAEIGHRRKPSV